MTMMTGHLILKVGCSPGSMNCMLNFKLVGPILALRYVIRLH